MSHIEMPSSLPVPGGLPPKGPNEETSSTNGETGPSPVCAVDFSPILKYDDPVLAKPHAGFDMGTGPGALPQQQQQQQQQQQYVSLSASSDERPTAPASGSYGVGGVRNRRRPHAKENNTAALKAIIPNKEWIDEAGTWVQTASSAERTRAELELLHGEVDARLSAFQARPGPVCAVREQVFSDLYDEVIREITLESPERGLLLLRLRDETRMNLDTYSEIYRDSVVFSRRKAEGAREELDSVRSLLAEVEEQITGHETQVRSLEAELAAIDRSNAYAKVITDQEHAETLEAARTEQRALEAAIAKSQKKLREAATVGVAGV